MLIYIFTFFVTSILVLAARQNYLKYIDSKKKFCILYNSINCKSNDTEEKLLRLRQIKREKYSNYIFTFLLALIPLLLLTGLRKEVGTDVMYTYVPNFYRANAGLSVDYTEFGFNFLIYLLARIFDSPTSLLFVTGAIYLVFVMLICIKNSENPVFSIIILLLGCFYFYSLNNIRQAISIALCLYSIKFIIKKKFLPTIICLFIAVSFHFSALIMLIPYIFVNIKFIRKNCVFVFVVLILLIPVLAVAFKQFISYTSYNYFLISDFNNARPNIINFVYNTIFFIFAFHILYSKNRMTRTSYVLLCLQFFAMFFSILSYFVPVGELLSRLISYFSIYQIILIPYLYNRIRIRSNRNAFLLMIVAMYATYMVYYIILKGYYDVLPYVSVINNPF